MKKTVKIVCTLLGLCSLGLSACGKSEGDTVRLTVWVSEADREFALSVAEEFKKAHPEKNYQFTIDIQGENDVATRVLNDVENSADVYSFINDQLSKFVNGDALARIAGERLERVKQANSEDSIDSVTLYKDGEESVYGMPYTDNTFFLYYDKSVLTEEDVKSIDGILSKCSASRQFAYPMKDGWYNSAFYFGKGLGYEVTYDANFAETEITCDFDSATGEKVTEAMWKLVKDARVKADADDSKITAGFNDKSIVCAVSGIWNRKAIESYLGDNFGATKLPTYTFEGGEQVQLISFAGYKAMGVNNYSKNKTDAMEFAEFYTNRENQIKHFTMRGFVPTDESARADEKVQSDVCAKAITAQLAHSKTQKEVPSTLWIPLEGLGSAMIAGKQSGNFNVKAQLKACVDAIEKKSGI